MSARARDRVIDLVVVVGVLAISLVELLLGGGFGDFAEVSTEPDGLAVALVLLSALALLWRDQHPRATVLATLTLSLVLVALGYGVHAPAAPAVALYAFAIRPRRERSWPVLAITTAAWVALVAIEVAVTPY